jgi:predicted dehydrogenase
MKIGIIGCGLIGNKRAINIHKNDRIISVCDNNIKVAKELSEKLNCEYTDNYNQLIKDQRIDVIIIATPNFLIKEIAINALKNNKHVLSEKPLGRNSFESKEIYDCANQNDRIIYTGFNHRFHPAVMKAEQIYKKGYIGNIIHIHGHYGHGGRKGMEKEWRMQKKLSGGGELLDQGVHLIDLAILFQGYPRKVYGSVDNLVWKSEVEDSSSFILYHKHNIKSLFSVGWIYWKNKFELSIYGDRGYIQISGLGGSYGSEKLIFGIRNLEGGKPEIRNYYFPKKDISWKKEWSFFKKLIINKCISKNGLEANMVVDAIYKSSKEKREVKL